MSRSHENQGFTCARCGRHVEPLTNGSYRNHCPFCLYSRHVDVRPGDRQATCGGDMAPVAIRRSRRGWQILHRCARCGRERLNVVAASGAQPDSIDAICALIDRTNRDALPDH